MVHGLFLVNEEKVAAYRVAIVYCTPLKETDIQNQKLKNLFHI